MSLIRNFIYNAKSGRVVIPDPGLEFSEEEVKQLAAIDYPELLNAAIIIGDVVDGAQEYTLVENASASEGVPVVAEIATASSRPTGKSSVSNKSVDVEFKPSAGRKG